VTESEITSFDTFYTTRYMGAKYKLLDLIIPRVHDLLPEGGVFVDLMAGTHAVGYALKSRNVIFANDIQHYSFIFGQALIMNSNVLSVKTRVLKDFEGISECLSAGWFSKTYGETYFSTEQCLQIEAIRSRISTLEDETVKSVYLTVLTNAMSLCQSSAGHFAQFMPSTSARIQSLRKMNLLDTFISKSISVEITQPKFANKVFKEEGISLLHRLTASNQLPKGSLVYLDPPYTSAQYSRYYHLLETVILNDQPNVNFKALYRDGRFQSPFCSSRLAPSAFKEVARGASQSGSSLLISYSNAGVLSVESIEEICRAFYHKIEVFKKPYAHSMQGRGVKKDREEIVISCSGPKKSAQL